jgi:hypothetical protein
VVGTPLSPRPRRCAASGRATLWGARCATKVEVDSAGTLSAVLAARRLGAERVIALSRYPDSQAAAAAAGWLGQLQYL